MLPNNVSLLTLPHILSICTVLTLLTILTLLTEEQCHYVCFLQCKVKAKYLDKRSRAPVPHGPYKKNSRDHGWDPRFILIWGTMPTKKLLYSVYHLLSKHGSLMSDPVVEQGTRAWFFKDGIRFVHECTVFLMI